MTTWRRHTIRKLGTTIRKEHACSGIIIAVAATLLSFASNTAIANCVGPDVARFAALGAQQRAAIARLNAGDCSALADWKRAMTASYAILRDSAQRPNCTPTFKYPKPPTCRVSRTAKAAPLEGAAQSHTAACPPLAPAGPWQRSNAAYCANANCVERGSAYYGSICFPPTPQQNVSQSASGASQPLTTLTSDQQARAGKAWATVQSAGQNASPSQRRAEVGAAVAQLLQKDAELLNLIPQYLDCPTDAVGDQQVRFLKCINERLAGIEEGDSSPPPGTNQQATTTQGQPTPMVTIDPKNKYCEPDYGAPAGSGIQTCWLEASNGYCMKWRETPNGSKVASDFDPADQQSFSDNVANAGLYTQHCPPGADAKWILYWTPKKDR
jgi:hypothetical protein